MSARATLLVFNTVERLFRGDFFHCVTEEDVRADLDRFPSDWRVVGLGTTNWHRRNGEVLIDGQVACPTFAWADPMSEPPGATVDLHSTRARALARVQRSPSLTDRRDQACFPFVAVAACDPDGRSHTWELRAGELVHTAIAKRCAMANVGLAAIEVAGRLRTAACQAMCHLPIGGVTLDRPAEARSSQLAGAPWTLMGFYSANPTVRAMLADESVAVHLHGRDKTTGRGGHLNAALAGSDTVVRVWPLRDLIVRIPNLDVAAQPVRALG